MIWIVDMFRAVVMVTNWFSYFFKITFEKCQNPVSLYCFTLYFPPEIFSKPSLRREDGPDTPVSASHSSLCANFTIEVKSHEISKLFIFHISLELSAKFSKHVSFLYRRGHDMLFPARWIEQTYIEINVNDRWLAGLNH